MTLAPDAVRSMFDRIAPVYDLMNRLMTVGLDGRWRRLAASLVVRPGDRVLDAACGTGDLAVADLEAGARSVTGLDFSERMLERARAKAPALEWVQGDMLALPFDAGSFDAATVGFGVRNVADLPLALRELRRVLRPGGRLAILEITQPRGVAQAVLRPVVRPGRAVARQGAARQDGPTPTCPRRSSGSRRPSRWWSCSREAGFAQVEFRLLAGSIVALHTGVAV